MVPPKPADVVSHGSPGRQVFFSYAKRRVVFDPDSQSPRMTRVAPTRSPSSPARFLAQRVFAELRRHLPETFLNLRYSPVEIVGQSPDTIREMIFDLVGQSLSHGRLLRQHGRPGDRRSG